MSCVVVVFRCVLLRLLCVVECPRVLWLCVVRVCVLIVVFVCAIVVSCAWCYGVVRVCWCYVRCRVLLCGVV